MKIREVMGKGPQEIGPEASILEAAQKMRSLKVGALIVFDEGRIAGIVTERDILVKVVAEGRSPETVRVKEIMTMGVDSVAPDDDLEEAYRRMASGHFRHLPVVEGGRFVGVLSLRTLVETRDRQKAEVIEHLREYILGGRGPA